MLGSKEVPTDPKLAPVTHCGPEVRGLRCQVRSHIPGEGDPASYKPVEEASDSTT